MKKGFGMQRLQIAPSRNMADPADSFNNFANAALPSASPSHFVALKSSNKGSITPVLSSKRFISLKSSSVSPVNQVNPERVDFDEGNYSQVMHKRAGKGQGTPSMRTPDLQISTSNPKIKKHISSTAFRKNSTTCHTPLGAHPGSQEQSNSQRKRKTKAIMNDSLNMISKTRYKNLNKSFHQSGTQESGNNSGSSLKKLNTTCEIEVYDPQRYGVDDDAYPGSTCQGARFGEGKKRSSFKQNNFFWTKRQGELSSKNIMMSNKPHSTSMHSSEKQSTEQKQLKFYAPRTPSELSFQE